MVKGRRAADRRREREGASDDDGEALAPADDIGTTPGAVPASPHTDYEEIDDDADDEDASSSSSAASILDAPAQAVRAQDRPSRARSSAASRPVVDDEPASAEAGLRAALKAGRPDTRIVALEVTAVKALPGRGLRGGMLLVLDDELHAVSEHAIAHNPTLIGRGRESDVRLVDPTVSLRHVELSWDDDGFSIVDLGSASGTLRNGTPIDRRTRLGPGDLVQVGRTTLRLLPAAALPVDRPLPEPVPEEEAVPEPVVERTGTNTRLARVAAAAAAAEAAAAAAAAAAERRRRVRRSALLVIGGCVLVFAVLVGARALWNAVASDRSDAQIRLQVATLLGEARRMLEHGDVDGAKARVSALLALDATNEESRSLDRMVHTEGEARDALALALRLGDEDRDDEALEVLRRIADTSVFAPQRNALRAQLQARDLQRTIRRIESLLDQARVDEALAVAEALAARLPGHPDVQALLQRLRAMKSTPGQNPALAAARAAFAGGRVDEARALALAAGYAGYAADVERFASAIGQGSAALSRFDGATALPFLDDAFRLLSGLGAGASSPVFAAVKKPYGDALYLSGTEKLDKGDGCGAARDLFKAARVAPDDAKVRTALQTLAGRADEALVIARGTRLQDAERSRTIARDALCLAQSGSKAWDDLRALAR